MNREIKKSELFWNLIPVFIQICIGFWKPPLLFLIQCIITMIWLFFTNSDDRNTALFLLINPIFIAFSLIKLLIIIIGGIIGSSCDLISEKLEPFNKWLDKEKEKKPSNFKEFTHSEYHKKNKN